MKYRYAIFRIEIISNKMFWCLQPKRSQSDILQMARPNTHGHVVQPIKAGIDINSLSKKHKVHSKIAHVKYK